MRFPSTELVGDLCGRAHADIDKLARLWPIVAEHSRRGGVRMPAGAEGAAHAEGEHSDPTADAVITAMERPPEPEAAMRRAMLRTLDALHRLDLARKAMEGQVPAVAAAIADGRAATDGRTMAEIVAIKEHRRATHGDLDCLACHRPTAHRIAGFDEACYRSWVRAGKPERSTWIVQRRKYLDEQARQQAEVVALDASSYEWDESRHRASSQGLAA